MDKYIYITGDRRLHYFGNNSILIAENEQLFFNQAETLFLEKMNGLNSLQQIAKSVADEVGLEETDELQELLTLFIEKEEVKQITEMAGIPTKKSLFMSGVKGYQYPLNILLEITNKCNLKCVHCYKEAGYNKSDEITHVDLFEKLGILAPHVNEIQISGGEPVSHRRFPEIINFAKENFNTVTITTAATLINARNVHLFEGLDLVQVSLYSWKKEEHEKVTLVKGSFERTIKGIQTLVKSNIPVAVTSIVTSENYRDIDSFVELCVDLKVNGVKFGVFSRSGRGKDLDKTWDLAPEVNSEVGLKIAELAERYSELIEIANWSDDSTESKMLDYNHGGFSCGAGNLAWTITENGNIRPCVFLPEDKFTTGNIFTDSIDFILKKEHIKNLYSNLETWERELNSNGLSTSNVCPVMKNYLEGYNDYISTR